ncbi:MAG: glycosyltransferase [Acidobacteriales bacterium]|nr:glycosyltransferase [Terriglobales bacterium]
MPLRITFFGLTLSSSWGNGHATPYRALIRALHALGHQITFFEKDVPYYARHRDFTAVEYCDLVLYQDYSAVSSQALARARQSDVVVMGSYCPEGARIAEDLFRDVGSGALLVFYDLDTPITLGTWSRGEEVEYVRQDQLPLFDLVLSFTGGGILGELEQRYGARMARPLYGCVDADVYSRVAAEPKFVCDLSYMGTYAADRQAKLASLFLSPAAQLSTRQFLLAGSMYPPELALTSNIKRMQHVSPYEHPALYSSSGLTLNITRGEMAAWGYCPSGRFFEASACRCPIVTDEWTGLDTFFEISGAERELLLARRTQDVLDALALDPQERAAIAGRARERTLDEHTGTQRARQFLRACEEAANATMSSTAEGAAS